MSSDEQSDKECPLCMEPFDEVDFYPCTCHYQICTFCWHRLRTDENGLCPACRQPYPEQPVNYQPLSSAKIRKIKNEKRQKQQKANNGTTGGKSGELAGHRKPDRQHLSAFRVLQRNLVYVIGLSQRLADAELLKKQEYFGKFGRIVKIAIGAFQSPNQQQANNVGGGNAGGPAASYTAYVTYSRMEEALRAIQTVNNLVIDGRLLKASLGTTKYCSNFLKGQNCHKQECMYLHDIADDELSFTKDDMHQGKHMEYERKLHEQMLSAQLPHKTASVNNGNGADGERDCKTTKSEPIFTTTTTTTSSSSASSTIDESPPTAAVGGGGLATAAGALTRCATAAARHDSDDDRTSAPVGGSLPNGYFHFFTTTNNNAAADFLGDGGVPPPLPPSLADAPSSTSSGGVESLFQQLDYGAVGCNLSNYVLMNNCDYNGLSIAAAAAAAAAPTMASTEPKMMTCWELEQMLLHSAPAAAAVVPPPPGFERLAETTSTREPATVTSGANFFLDLYDDLGFDPFSESSKALADLLEEEKTTGSFHS